MGRELIVAYPIFKVSLEEADGYLKSMGADWSLMDELYRELEARRVNEDRPQYPDLRGAANIARALEKNRRPGHTN